MEILGYRNACSIIVDLKSTVLECALTTYVIGLFFKDLLRGTDKSEGICLANIHFYFIL